jgi:serine protease inhibitor
MFLVEFVSKNQSSVAALNIQTNQTKKGCDLIKAKVTLNNNRLCFIDAVVFRG